MAADGARTTADQWLRAGAPPLFILLWSSGFIFVAVALRDVDPLTLLALRYVFVEAILLPLVLLLRPRRPRGVEWLHLAAVGFMLQAVHFGGINVALRLGMTPGATALMTSLQPVLVGLLAPWLTGEAVSARRWLGLALGLAGAVLVIVARARLGALPVWGLLAAVAALLGLTFGTLYERRFGGGQHPVMASLVQCAVGLLVSLPLAVLTEPMRVHVTLPMAVSLGYLVICNSLVALSLLMAMIRLGEASRVSALFFLVPPATAVLAWLVLGERVAPLGWLGLAISAAGVAVVTLERRRVPAAA